MRFIKRMGVFVNSPTHSRTIATLIVFAILIAIPLTVIVAQQQQEIRQRAESDPQNVCPNIANIPDCNSSGSLNCQTPGDKCKLLSTIYECK